jgi:hypothetical protein
MLISDDPNNPGGRNAHTMLAAQLSRQRLDYRPLSQPPVMHNCLLDQYRQLMEYGDVEIVDFALPDFRCEAVSCFVLC